VCCLHGGSYEVATLAVDRLRVGRVSRRDIAIVVEFCCSAVRTAFSREVRVQCSGAEIMAKSRVYTSWGGMRRGLLRREDALIMRLNDIATGAKRHRNRFVWNERIMLTLALKQVVTRPASLLRRWVEIVNLIASKVECINYSAAVPEIASRKHLEVLNPLLFAAERKAGISWRDIDLVAVMHDQVLLCAAGRSCGAGRTVVCTTFLACGVNHIEGLYAAGKARAGTPSARGAW